MAKSENKKDTSHHGGEEWRDLDQGPKAYDPSAHEDILKQARHNIRNLRMGDATLRLVDERGKPLTGVQLDIAQLKHRFPFGEQLWSLDAMYRRGEGESERAEVYKRRFREIFNAANNLTYWTERPRNDGSKTEDQQGEWKLEQFAKTVDWTLASGMAAKGHPLFWSIPKCVPEWVKRYDYETRMKFAEVRVRNIVARFRGRVTMWDAVNEPMWEPAFKNLDQRQWPHIEKISDIADYVGEVLRWCREEDPDGVFVVNDYGMEQDKGRKEPLVGNDGSKVTARSQRRRFVALFNELQQRGRAPDMIGLQSHTGWLDHDEQWSVYDDFRSTGLPIQITEFWANESELRKSGRYSDEEIENMRDEYVLNYLTCAFGHPAVEGFFFWGVTGKLIQWRDPHNTGHELSPLFGKLKKRLHEEWNTCESVTTDGDGAAAFRGFYGDYSVRLPLANGLRHGLAFTHDPSGAGATHTFRIPAGWSLSGRG